MSSNETQNIYSSEYRNGSVTPTAASAVTFDGTASGLSATNVQAAIDEVVGDIPEIPATYAASAITYDNTTSGLTATDAQAAIDEVATVTEEVKGNYVNSGYGTVVVNADGTKSFDTLLNELKTEITSLLASIENDEFVIPKSLYITSFYSLVADYTSGWAKGSTNFTPSFSRAGGSAAKGIIARVIMGVSNEMYAWTIETTGNTVKNWLTDVPTAVQTLTFYYEKKKLV